MNIEVATFISTIIAALISSGVALFVFCKNNNANQINILNAQLDTLLRISVKYPYLESISFTYTWKDNNKNEDEKYRRYESYATMVFNFLERMCKFYNYNEKKINAFLNVKGWVEIHKYYWHYPTIPNENEKSYDEKFKKYICKILGEISQ